MSAETESRAVVFSTIHRLVALGDVAMGQERKTAVFVEAGIREVEQLQRRPAAIVGLVHQVVNVSPAVE
nr:unnamed protein product [Digitaria exilis]CAB3445210.1 unnamed protein product [Digitaria exilis]CAB3503197.1 unnamed protein product [Digitaria exilis]